MPDWSTFESAVERLDDDFDWRAVTVYEWTETYDHSTGDYSEDYAEHAESPVKMELTEPSEPRLARSAAGTDVEIDAEAWPQSDVAIDWMGMDSGGEHPTTLETGGATYRVVSAFDEDNGLTRLDLTRE